MPGSTGKTVLVSPLNWGLGHAARLVPVIKILQHKRYNIIIGAYGASAGLLKKEFPGCKHIELPGFTPEYSEKHSQTFALIKQVFSFLSSKRKEHKLTQELIKDYEINLIISDNRYGVRSNKVRSVLITHQISPRLNGIFKWTQTIIAFFLSRWINKFDQCWIPDIDTPPGLSGKLSNNPFDLKNTIKTGILSRFTPCPDKPKEPEYKFDYDNIAIISGPEPWRSLFERDVTELFEKDGGRSVIIKGVPEKGNDVKKVNNITFYNHCKTPILKELICSSKNIICRPGYSTVMDLFRLGRRALLVPTPGQPEQEYLAHHLNEHFGFDFTLQKSLKNGTLETSTDIVIFPFFGNQLPENMIDRLV
jgi:hypothetical protein